MLRTAKSGSVCLSAFRWSSIPYHLSFAGAENLSPSHRCTKLTVTTGLYTGNTNQPFESRNASTFLKCVQCSIKKKKKRLEKDDEIENAEPI